MEKTTGSSGLWNTTPVKELFDSELNCRIQKKAKKLWEEKGCVQGKDLDNWLEAEKSVKSNKSRAQDFPRLTHSLSPQAVQIKKDSLENYYETKQTNDCLV